jgi:osmotically-inducible protein OsmY
MNDKDLRQSVVDELDWEPSIDSADIGVAVQNGLVTLTGHVRNYAQKFEAEKAVKRVKGVRGVVQELKVRYDAADPYSDEDIAERALTALDLNVSVPRGKVYVKVQQGWVTLTGDVDWQYQREAAEADIRKLTGVMGISNMITLKPRALAIDITKRIQDALRRDAQLEAGAISVVVSDGGKVTLEGQVHSFHDREVAERAAWSAPGVRQVADHVEIR